VDYTQCGQRAGGNAYTIADAHTHIHIIADGNTYRDLHADEYLDPNCDSDIDTDYHREPHANAFRNYDSDAFAVADRCGDY
jgi:hypothetical protein